MRVCARVWPAHMCRHGILRELTWRRNNGSHGESISDALSHGNDIRDDSVALKAPHVASRSPKSGLDLSGEKPVVLSRTKRGCRLGCTGDALINVGGIHLQNFHRLMLSRFRLCRFKFDDQWESDQTNNNYRYRNKTLFFAFNSSRINKGGIKRRKKPHLQCRGRLFPSRVQRPLSDSSSGTGQLRPLPAHRHHIDVQPTLDTATLKYSRFCPAHLNWFREEGGDATGYAGGEGLSELGDVLVLCHALTCGIRRMKCIKVHSKSKPKFLQTSNDYISDEAQTDFQADSAVDSHKPRSFCKWWMINELRLN